ncbi:hypothetical protein [Psychromonas sp. Urea-02u-13]|uniref:hypothetical protein n=1 Tax=Psychromonas sp. Urea-02u-13 TaxID=2058326 RepID=UPI000C346CEB|nr:hypothetical protein [Psychromonas sp. Urea-02u-13]PKG40198.1 hypothetical protein CXF74_03765 [Psychromonas sp. Urea-02u-13]
MRLTKMLKYIVSFVWLVINGYFCYKIAGGDKVWADLSGLATINIAILTVFIVVFGLSQLRSAKEQLNVANNQLREVKKDNVRSFSHTAYSQYLKLTLEYPHFAHPDPELIKSDSAMHSHYRWFISNMLFYFEEVIMINDGDKDWSKAISRQIRIHMWQIGSYSSYKQQGWSQELLKIIDSSSASKYYKNNKKKADNNGLGEVESLYQEYLTLLLKHPKYYKQDKASEETVSNSSEYFVFLKNAYYLLGCIMELSSEDSEWTILIQIEKQKLEMVYNSLNKNKFTDNELMLKKHRKLLTI